MFLFFTEKYRASSFKWKEKKVLFNDRILFYMANYSAILATLCSIPFMLFVFLYNIC